MDFVPMKPAQHFETSDNPSVFLLSFPNVLIHFIRNTRLAAASTGQPGIGKRCVFPAQTGLSESSIVRFSTGLGGGHPKQEQQRSLLLESALYQCRKFLVRNDYVIHQGRFECLNVSQISTLGRLGA